MFWSRAIIFFSTLLKLYGETPKEAKETVETVEFGVAIYVNIRWYGETERLWRPMRFMQILCGP